MAKKVTRTPEEIQGEINAYEILLRDTDYISHKHADGALTDEEYEETKAQRESWRQAIRDLREELPAE
ncbi:MAG: hypothetical protein IJV16_08035 [Lachnospiraceae bacterium]|nr:hypothetical protein [Lachnospiraceae bacterium]